MLLKRVSLDSAAAALTDPGQRQLAYEMAVCVCDADGRRNPAETAFLTDLKVRLGLSAGQTEAFEREEAALVDAAEGAVPVVPTGSPVAAGRVADPAREAALDKTVLNAALLNGALELLPQSLSLIHI